MYPYLYISARIEAVSKHLEPMSNVSCLKARS
jgi:hypothetical protein